VFGFGQAAGYGWTSGLVLGTLAAAAVLLTLFVVLQGKVREPLLPLKVVSARNRVGAFLSVALNFIGTFGMFLFVTYQLQTVMHYSPIQAGCAFLPLMVMSAITATQIVARLLPKVQPRVLIAPGLLIAAAGMFLLTFLTTDSSYVSHILPAEVLVGLGSGAIMSPSLNTATRDVAPSDTGVISAFVSTSQQIGASVGTALLNTIAAGTTASYLAAHVGVGQIEGNVYGYRVACAWAAGILVVAAVLAAVLINTRPQRH
jgi:predicted MFS family arabinose efflux permease